MERFKSVLSSVVAAAVVLAVYGGWYMYRQDRLQQNIQMEIRRLKAAKPAQPKGGVVVDRDGTIRWQD